MTSQSNKSLLVVGGEASADMHAARVIAALKENNPQLHIFGIGGEQMRAQGMEVVAPAEDLATAGLTEVIFALPRIFGIMRRMEKKAKAHQPAAALLLDLPDFNLRLAKRLKRLGIPVIYYISPQLWAWRPKRVETVRQLVDHMLVILPFEEEFYTQHQVPVEFVGHPLCEILPENPDTEVAKNQLELDASAHPIVALLPGSRRKEVLRHLPRMLDAMKLLSQDKPNMQILIPVASTIPKPLIEELVEQSALKANIIEGKATEVINASDLAVVCSGTATLQTALLLKPMVVVYRVSWLSYQILRRLVRIANIGLVNLVAGKTLATELVQNAFSATNLKQECLKLIEDVEHRNFVVQELSQLRSKLTKPNTAKRVGEIIQKYLPSKP
jgi:lipid-A-disaccharide synthase